MGDWGGGSPTHPVRPGLRLRAGSFIPAMARYFGATGGSTSSNEGVEWSESARWVLENTELLWTPFLEPQEDGSVGFGRIQISCRGSENPIPSVHLGSTDLKTYEDFPGLQDRVLSKCSDAHIYLDNGT